jgi:diguanylate cyclase (GGDEF)-like protein
MPNAMPTVPIIALEIVQMGVGVALAALFRYSRRVYRRAHLSLWSQSFALMALALMLSRLAPFADRGLLSIVLAFGAEFAGYLHIGFLVLGTLALLRGPKLPANTLVLIIGAALVASALSTLPSVLGNAEASRGAFHGLPREMTTALSYLGLAVALLEHARRFGARFGQRVVGLAFAFYGSFNFAALAIGLIGTRSFAKIDVDPIASLVDAIALIGIGFGLVIWLLEDEHDRAEGALRDVERLTWFDPATGLPNRRQLEHRLGALLEQLGQFSRRAAVFALELDRPQRLRESLGVQGTQQLLAEMADRFGEDLGENEILARLEHDRFALVIPDALQATAAWRGMRLLRRLREPFTIGDGAVYATLSIGIATYPVDGRDPDTLLQAALLTLGRIHADGGDAYRFHADDGQDHDARGRLALAGEIRRALENDELELHYQPIVDARRLVMISAEALVRWRHPQRGIIPPDSFLHAVDDAGAMRQLDAFVLRKACTQIAAWRAEGLHDVIVAVNVSAQSFQSDGFTDLVRDELDRAGIAPPQLELEITEASAMRDLDSAAETLERLRRLGVAVTIDDFGMGFSSLSRLKHLAVDKLKIDRTFTMGVTAGGRDAAIAGAIVALAHGLGLRVDADGVETWEQAAFFRTQGVLGLQGYRFHHPLPADELAPLLGREQSVVASR